MAYERTAMTLVDRHVAFLAALREAGVGVSLAEDRKSVV